MCYTLFRGDFNMADIGERIKEFRKWRGLTQQQLADATQISVMSIRRYESGERTPTENVINEIARVLRVNPADLDERQAIYLGSDTTVIAEDGTHITLSSDTREAAILIRFQAMNSDGKDELIRQADILLEVGRFRRPSIDVGDFDLQHLLDLYAQKTKDPEDK